MSFCQTKVRLGVITMPLNTIDNVSRQRQGSHLSNRLGDVTRPINTMENASRDSQGCHTFQTKVIANCRCTKNNIAIKIYYFKMVAKSFTNLHIASHA